MNENPINNFVSKAEKERQREKKQEEFVLKQVIRRLLLPVDTTWEEIHGAYSPTIIAFLKGDVSYGGFTAPSTDAEKVYRAAEEVLKSNAEKIDARPFVEAAELLLGRYGQEQLKQLTSITLKEEALNNELRKAAVKDRFAIVEILESLQQFTDVDTQTHEALDRRVMELRRAIGAIQKDETVEHLN